MPILSTSKRKNGLEVLRRNWAWAFFGERPEGIAQNIDALNGEAILALKYSATQPSPAVSDGNNTIGMIGVDNTNTIQIPGPNVPAAPVNIGNGGGVTIPNFNGQFTGPGMLKTVTYDVALNASIGTTAFFIADQAYTVNSISAVQKTQGTGTAVYNVTHDTGTQAAGAGASLQTGTFNSATLVNNTVTAGVLAATGQTIAAGDRLSVLFTGTTTTLAGVTVTVVLTPSVASETSQYYVRVNGDVATQNFFCANRDMVVTGISLMFGTAFATSTTLGITHDTTTGAPGSGSELLAAVAPVDGSTTAINTVVSPALTATTANLTLRAGDRLSTKFSATTTGAGVIVVVTFAPIYARKEISWQLGPNAQQQVAQNFFIADHNYEVVDASCSYGTAAGGAAKIGVTIDKGTAAPGTGNVVQTDNTNAGFDLNSTTGTAQFMTPAALHLRLMSPGDRLGLVVAGAAQSIADVVITVSLRPNS